MPAGGKGGGEPFPGKPPTRIMLRDEQANAKAELISKVA